MWLNTQPGAGKEEVVSCYHHQSHLHHLPDSQDHPHGGPAEDVAHVHGEAGDEAGAGHAVLAAAGL